MHGLEHWEAARSRIGDAMVVFESKGADSLPILERLIPGLLTVDVCDPATPMVDLLGAGDAMERAGRFADLMQRAFVEPPQAIALAKKLAAEVSPAFAGLSEVSDIVAVSKELACRA